MISQKISVIFAVLAGCLSICILGTGCSTKPETESIPEETAPVIQTTAESEMTTVPETTTEMTTTTILETTTTSTTETTTKPNCLKQRQKPQQRQFQRLIHPRKHPQSLQRIRPQTHLQSPRLTRPWLRNSLTHSQCISFWIQIQTVFTSIPVVGQRRKFSPRIMQRLTSGRRIFRIMLMSIGLVGFVQSPIPISSRNFN